MSKSDCGESRGGAYNTSPVNGRLSEFSILIVTWNGDDLLRQCLDSLAAVCGTEPEIVVVDNAASTETERLVVGFPNCKYVRTEKNLGFAGGNNLGFAYCSRPYVVLLNNDTIVHADSLTPLMQYLDEHLQVGVVQGTLVLGRDGKRIDTCGGWMSPLGGCMSNHGFELLTDIKAIPEVVFAAKGAFTMFRRSLVDELPCGLFHGEFFNNYEDIDFCHRVWLTGKEVHYVPTPPIDHLQNKTIAKLPKRDVRTRELANAIFSLHSVLGGYGLFVLLPRFYVYRFLMFLRCVLTFKGQDAKVYLAAVGMAWNRRREIAKARRVVQAARRVSDRELLKRVVFRPPLSYWLNAARIWLSGKF